MTVRPPYIYQGGSVLMHPPLELKQSEMYGYFVKGDLACLQASVDSTLNAVAGKRMYFKALSPYVMITFTRVGHANSARQVDRDKGWITEIDIVTWIMVGSMDAAGKLSYIYWYPIHIFVDDTMALINGRELFGYPKYECTYDIPEPGSDPLRCALSAKGFQPFSPDTRIAMHPLMEISATQTEGKHKPIGNWIELMEEAITLLASIPDFFNMDKEGIADILTMLRNPRIDQIFLKQFPDTAGVKAVYQALVAAPAEIGTIRGGSLLGYDYTCSLHAFDSFPLNKTLGLQLGAQPAILPFHLSFDFTQMAGEELVDNSSIAPEKIAIIGGGVGSMTTAYYLTEQPGWQNRYDITVYQQGWRLGGKGASGRNAALGQRIEEHGLHIWFGFYVNAFATIKAAYAAMDRPPGSPLATWKDAFKQHDYVALSEWVNHEWRNWSIVFPTLPGEPGTGTESVGLWQLATALVAWIKMWLHQLHDLAPQVEKSYVAGPDDVLPAWLHHLAGEVKQEARSLAQDARLAVNALELLAGSLGADSRQHDSLQHSMMAHALTDTRALLHERYGAQIDNDDVRRLLTVLDIGLTVMKGMLEDGVLIHGFDVINDIDLRVWLAKHGGNPDLCVNSAPIRGFYDLVFAYEDGNFEQPNVEAGTMLRAALRIAFAYKGGIMFKMQAGMGDTIFTPFYEVLSKRGVKFKFFHQVEELIPDADTVGSIRLRQQVKLATPDGRYQPLVDVKDLGCWPSTPNYAQIDPEQAALLQTNKINLESYWSDWPQVYEQHFGQPLPTILLRRGVDFDKVLFGASVASLPVLCPQLLARSPALNTTAEKVRSVATQAYQVWLSKDLNQMGWTDQPNGQQPVLSGFTEPYDTWAPMDQLLCREQWPVTDEPHNVSYFCSAFPMAHYPPRNDFGFPANCAATAKAGAIHQLSREVTALWPQAGAPGAFKWEWLIDPSQGEGVARFDSQYWRANVDPSERYVMSVVNSTQYRLATDGAGFSNLFLTGDWIKTGLNAGCVEAAVMAGMQASRAISGYPKVIVGETDF